MPARSWAVLIVSLVLLALMIGAVLVNDPKPSAQDRQHYDEVRASCTLEGKSKGLEGFDLTDYINHCMLNRY